MRAALAAALVTTTAVACAPQYPYDWPSDYTRAPIGLAIHQGGQALVQFRTAPAARCVEATDPTQPLGFVDSLGDFSIYEVPGPGQQHLNTIWHCAAPGHGSLPDVHVSITVVPDDVPAPQPTMLSPTRHQIDAASAKDGIDVLTATDAKLQAKGLDPRPPDPTSHAYQLWLNGIVSTLYSGVPMENYSDDCTSTHIVHGGLVMPVVTPVVPGANETVDASTLHEIVLQFSFGGGDWIALLSGDQRNVVLGELMVDRTVTKRIPIALDSATQVYAVPVPSLRGGVRYTISIERRPTQWTACPPPYFAVGSFTTR